MARSLKTTRNTQDTPGKITISPTGTLNLLTHTTTKNEEPSDVDQL